MFSHLKIGDTVQRTPPVFKERFKVSLEGKVVRTSPTTVKCLFMVMNNPIQLTFRRSTGINVLGDNYGRLVK